MGPVVGKLSRQRRRGGQKARVAAHHDGAIDPFERLVVEIGPGEGLGDEARGGGKARDMIEADEVVVDGLGDVDGAQRMSALLRFLRDDAHGVGGIVAADIEERVDRMRLQDLEDLLAIFEVRLVAGRAERCGGRGGDRLEIGDRLLAEIDEIVVDDAAHPVQRAIDPRNAREPARLERHPDQRLVDDRGRAAPLSDKDLVRHQSLPFPPGALTGRTAGSRQMALGAARVTRKPDLADLARKAGLQNVARGDESGRCRACGRAAPRGRRRASSFRAASHRLFHLAANFARLVRGGMDVEVHHAARQVLGLGVGQCRRALDRAVERTGQRHFDRRRRSAAAGPWKCAASAGPLSPE